MKNCMIPHERQLSVNCLFCGKKINLSYEEKNKAMALLVSKEDKQKILDLLHEGKSIGETREAVGLDLGVMCEIINQNIHHYGYLGKDAV